MFPQDWLLGISNCKYQAELPVSPRPWPRISSLSLKHIQAHPLPTASFCVARAKPSSWLPSSCPPVSTLPFPAQAPHRARPRLKDLTVPWALTMASVAGGINPDLSLSPRPHDVTYVPLNPCSHTELPQGRTRPAVTQRPALAYYSADAGWKVLTFELGSAFSFYTGPHKLCLVLTCSLPFATLLLSCL